MRKDTRSILTLRSLPAHVKVSVNEVVVQFENYAHTTLLCCLLRLMLSCFSDVPRSGLFYVFPADRLFGGLSSSGFQRGCPGAFHRGLLVSHFFLNRHGQMMTQSDGQMPGA